MKINVKTVERVLMLMDVLNVNAMPSFQETFASQTEVRFINYHILLYNTIFNVNNVVSRKIVKILAIYVSFTVNGGWGEWTGLGTCSKSCGGGQQVKKRKCNAPTPRNGGEPCDGLAFQTIKCGDISCNGELKLYPHIL